MTIKTEIIDIALPDGSGVARIDNKVVFVPEAVTGDKVNIEIIHEKKKFSLGKITELLEESPFRKKPFCPHFSECGGCSLQTFDYAKQLDIKQSYLLETLKRIGKADLSSTEIYPMEPSPQTAEFRNKVEVFSDGKSTGFYKRNSNDIANIDSCPVFGKTIDQIISSTKKLNFKQLVIREGKKTGDVMLVIVSDKLTSSDLKGKAEEYFGDSGLKSVYLAKPSRPSDQGDFKKAEIVFGDTYIEEVVSGVKFRIYPQTFFQTNTGTAELLYNRIIEFAKLCNAESAAGLYCGSGPIEIMLAKQLNNVTGIDSNPFNIENARENCTLNDIVNCKFIHGQVEKVFGTMQRSDLLVVNPPRSGISEKAITLILNSKWKKIIYVSCSPPTLARDINTLASKGYRIKAISAFDMFPHTGHMETAVLLEKK